MCVLLQGALSFEVSANELLDARAKGAAYAIMRVFNVPSPSATGKLAPNNPVSVAATHRPWEAIESGALQLVVSARHE